MNRAEKSGRELMNEALPQPTRLDMEIHRILRDVDQFASYCLGSVRHGNEWGDQDGARAARERIAECIRALVTKAAGNGSCCSGPYRREEERCDNCPKQSPR